MRMYVKGSIGIIIFFFFFIRVHNLSSFSSFPLFFFFFSFFSATLVVKSLINIRCIYIIVYNICIYIITYIREREREGGRKKDWKGGGRGYESKRDIKRRRKRDGRNWKSKFEEWVKCRDIEIIYREGNIFFFFLNYCASISRDFFFLNKSNLLVPFLSQIFTR